MVMEFYWNGIYITMHEKAHDYNIYCGTYNVLTRSSRDERATIVQLFHVMSSHVLTYCTIISLFDSYITEVFSQGSKLLSGSTGCEMGWHRTGDKPLTERMMV